MIEAVLASKLPGVLAPFLPAFVGTAADAGQKAVESIGGKAGEAAWNKAAGLWNKLRPEVEKQSDIAKAIQDVASKPNDPRAEALLSWNLEKLTLPPETLAEIQKILAETRGKTRITTATSGGVAIGGSAEGNIISSMDVDVQSYLIGHLGLRPRSSMNQRCLQLIDEFLPKKSSRNLPHSTVVKAMILNGLGFTSQRLYLFPNFFMTVPTEKLLGEGITPSDLNDDLIGRTLDAIYRFGPTELFNKISLQVMRQQSLGTQLIHVDTTNFSVSGKYEGDAPDGTAACSPNYISHREILKLSSTYLQS